MSGHSRDVRAIRSNLSARERAARLADLARAPWLMPVLVDCTREALQFAEIHAYWLGLLPSPSSRWLVNAADLHLNQWLDLVPGSISEQIVGHTMLPAQGRYRGAAHDPLCMHSPAHQNTTTASVCDVVGLVRDLPGCGACHGLSVDLRELHHPRVREAALVGALTHDNTMIVTTWRNSPTVPLHDDALRTVALVVRAVIAQAEAAPLSVPLAQVAERLRQQALDVIGQSLAVVTGLDRHALDEVSTDDLDVMAALLHPHDPHDPDDLVAASPSQHLQVLAHLETVAVPTQPVAHSSSVG